jgi:lipid-A-disaccharide synthase
VIALLAGSRRHEIEKVLPQMTRVMKYFPGYRFILAGVRNIPDDFYRKCLGDTNVLLVKERTYEILHIAEAALVTSGTATLEAALIGTPQVVCYKAALPEMLIAWLVIRVKYISLVNLVMDSEIVRELIQYDLNEKNLLKELKAILPGGEKRERILEGYDSLNKLLGPAGASLRIAGEMMKELRRNAEGIKNNPIQGTDE